MTNTHLPPTREQVDDLRDAFEQADMAVLTGVAGWHYVLVKLLREVGIVMKGCTNDDIMLTAREILEEHGRKCTPRPRT